MKERPILFSAPISPEPNTGCWLWTTADWTPRDCFRLLWGAINGAGSWSANPWVWVVSFRRVRP